MPWDPDQYLKFKTERYASFEDLLAHAREYARPSLRFARGDVRELEGMWDLIFSHAVLQWVEDHERLFARLWERLAPGGQLVVQMPATRPPHPRLLAGAGPG